MKNILVIEDSKMMNNIISKELRNLGLRVDQALTLKEARAFLTQKKYHLIILDLHLPDGEGSELIANIQSLTKTKVVVLTSLQDNDDLREELFSYGILDYIIKDKNLLYSISEIVKIIHTISSKTKDKILIIDDSDFICKQVKTLLEPRNYDVSKAHSAKEGFEKLQHKEYNLIILDLELPDMHGLKVLELIRKDVRFLHLPIMVLSGTTTPALIRETLKNGANDVMKKPFVFEEFILKVDLWIDYFKKDKALEEKTFELESMNENLERLVQEGIEANHEKEKMMLAQSRQAQMGEMISMIAHQWRQPLNAISMAVGMIEFRVKSGSFDEKAAQTVISKVNKYIQYLSGTIDDFRNFFKPQTGVQRTNFERIIQKSLVLIEHSLQHDNIALELNIGSSSDFVTYENELVQVVINLLKNAQDVLKEREVQDAKIIIEVEDNVLRVQDNGGGIEKEIIEKIFDPYFSTKSKNGTGLGLYMSKIIIQEHCNGELDVHNVQGGAQFTITLPHGEGVRDVA